jgi:hypothetical protein
VGIRFVIDEHLRVILLDTIRRHNATGGRPIDATEVGEPPDLPLGTVDPDLLAWAERNGRIVVSLDANTLAGLFYDQLAAARHLPGLFLVRRGAPLGAIVSFLEFATHSGDPADFADQVTYIP